MELVNQGARAYLLAIGLIGWQGPSAADHGRVRPDQERVRSLQAGQAGGPALLDLLLLEIESAGTYSLDVRSHDFSPTLTVFTADDDLVNRAATQHEAFGARLVLELSPGEYQLEIASQDGLAGEYRLTVATGAPPELSAAEQNQAITDYYRTGAERALQRAEPETEAWYLMKLGEQLYLWGDFEAARPAFERALELPTHGGDASVQAFACAYLGASLIQLGLIEQALERLDSCPQPDSVRPRFFIVDNLGKAHARLGQLEQALAANEQALELGRSHDQPDLAVIALGRLAAVREQMGDLDEARALHEQALAALENPRTLPAARQVRLAAGNFFENRGEFDRARSSYQAALELASSWSHRAALRAQLATIDMFQGRIGAARRTFRALQLERRKIDGQDRKFDRDLRRVLAKIASRLGEPQFALELRQQILAEVEDSPDLRLPIDALNDLATVLESMAQHAQAERFYRRSIELSETLGDATREARARLNLSRLLRDEQHFDAAEQMAQVALERSRSGQNRENHAMVLDELALCSLALGRLEKAQQAAWAAFAIFSELSGADYLLMPLLTLARIGLKRGDPDTVQELLDQADELFASGNFSELRGQEVASLRSDYHEWGQVAQDLTAMRWKLAEEDSGSATRTKIASQGFARAQVWKGRALLEGLRGSSDEPADRTDEQPIEERLAGLLGQDRVLIEYTAGEHRLYAFVIADGRLEFFDLGERSALVSAARQYLEGINDQSHLLSAPEIQRQAAPLYGQLLAPLLNDRDSTPKSLVIVPSAQLAGLPFEALVIGPAAEQDQILRLADLEYVLDRFDVTYGPSSAVLAELGVRRSTAPRERLLLIGDPLYSGEQAAVLPSSSRFFRLESTRDELSEVATQLLLDDGKRGEAFVGPLLRALRNRSDSLETPLFDLYLGGAATLAPLQRGSGAYRIIHLAAHGLVDPENPRNTSIILSADEHSSGLLGLDDVVAYGLDADLVVLSACSTARGRVLKGEGTQSMAYAFLRARSRAVIASLYDVADREAADTMKEFYRQHLGEGLPIAHALRLAKQKLRSSGAFRGAAPETAEDQELSSSAHPFYWAPFIYIGELESPR